VRINTLLNLAAQLDNETLMQNICEVLDIDYEEIKDRLPDLENADESLLAAESAIEGEDISDEEQQTQQAVLDMLESLLEEFG